MNWVTGQGRAEKCIQIERQTRLDFALSASNKIVTGIASYKLFRDGLVMTAIRISP